MSEIAGPGRAAPLPGSTWKVALVMGPILILGGVVALLNPFLATLTAAVVAALAFRFAGAMQLLLAVRGAGEGSRVLAGLLGALLILFAMSPFAHPIAGLVSLTLLVGSFFLAAGLVRVWLAFRMRGRRAWGWLLGSGLVSAALEVFILARLPEAAAAVLGILLGVELLTSGSAAVAFAFAARRG